MGNLIGNKSMASDFAGKFRINVKKITAPVLGDEIMKVKNKLYLNDHDQTTIKFLKAAINFLPMALEDGADLTNAVFLFAMPGSEFVVNAGKGKWEFYFSEKNPNKITGKCVHKPWLTYVWDKVSSAVLRFGGTLLSIGTRSLRALPGSF